MRPRSIVSSLSAAPAILLSVGSSGASGIGGHQASSAAVSASVLASVVLVLHPMKDLRLNLRLHQDLRDYLLEGAVEAPELAVGELVVDEHRNSGCLVSQRVFSPEGLMEETLVSRSL